MPGIDKLPLEDALEDSPQTRSLLGVFEEDAAAISSYSQQLYQALQRIHDAQTRSLLGVFEEDAAAISSYSQQLYQALQRIYDAQVRLLPCPHPWYIYAQNS
ncbi:UNVERIFIED_CONTAM: hypothetical protein FKN15_034703 [Acipenser sinensis]